ncbi:MAG: EamA family transporter RarD [Sphingobium sp.]
MMAATGDGDRRGLLAAIGAYGLWGLLPLFFKLLDNVGPVEVVAQRILWSFLLLLLFLSVRVRLALLRAVLRDGRIMRALALSAALIGANWLTYVWAIHSGHVVGASLGYFLNPLVNVLLAVLVLKEKLRRGQVIAVTIAALGVGCMAAAALDTLWVSIVLALTFALYGLIRKLTPVAAFEGLCAETLMLMPPALAWLAWTTYLGTQSFGRDGTTTALLIAGGAVTTVPLLLFAVAARHLSLATLGLLQYLAPTMQFLLGIFLFGETLNGGQMFSFGLIWLGLLFFAADGYMAARRMRAA